MRGIDARGCRHSSYLWDTLASANVQDHGSVATRVVVSVTTVAPPSTTAVTSATSSIICVSPAPSVTERAGSQRVGVCRSNLLTLPPLAVSATDDGRMAV